VSDSINDLGQVVGFEVENWQAPVFPSHEVLHGQYCSVEPLIVERHVVQLYQANSKDELGLMWTYLPYGPFDSLESYRAVLEKFIGQSEQSEQSEQQFYVVVDSSTRLALGIAAYLRINPAAGSIEVGHISFSPALQRSTIATEAMYLMMKKIFEAGYRRYEWKCNSLNEASKSAALRLGFQFEGIFRQAVVIDGRNRDTAWYSIIDSEWLSLQSMFEGWLSKSNFDQQGKQTLALAAFL